jgi:hypothetical protein
MAHKQDHGIHFFSPLVSIPIFKAGQLCELGENEKTLPIDVEQGQ